MDHIIGSKIDLTDMDLSIVAEFRSYIDDILTEDEVMKLNKYLQHLDTSRLQHSLNVAYYTFLICRKLGLNTREATRAALLHDFYFYDWKVDEYEGSHCYHHPRVALENSRRLFEVSDLMADAIVNHMWPMTLSLPKHKESWIVSSCDKYCASLEVLASLKGRVRASASSVLHHFRATN